MRIENARLRQKQSQAEMKRREKKTTGRTEESCASSRVDGKIAARAISQRAKPNALKCNSTNQRNASRA
jgi:hypothetical protein